MKRQTVKSSSGIVKLTETKLPFGLRMGQFNGVFIVDFMNQRDTEVSEIFASVALTKDLAEDILQGLTAFLEKKENHGSE